MPMDERRLAGRWPVVHLRETDSTNQRALEWDGEPVVIVADRQTAGRGRLGRRWYGRSGESLCFSVIVPPELQPALGAMSQVTLAAGLAVADGIATVAEVAACAIKWPNDVLIAGRKVAGILTESVVRGRIARVVIGIGINVAVEDFPPEVAGRATSILLATGRRIEGEVLLAAVVEQLSLRLDQLRTGGFTAIRRDWLARDAVLGRRLAWVKHDGTVITGRAESIDETGMLHVRDDDGILHAVLSGDVTLAER